MRGDRVLLEIAARVLWSEAHVGIRREMEDDLLSGRGRIFISEATYQDLLRADPKLAASCIRQDPQRVKGISGDIIVYEVPWRTPGSPEQDLEATAAKTPDSTAIVSIVQRG